MKTTKTEILNVLEIVLGVLEGKGSDLDQETQDWNLENAIYKVKETINKLEAERS